jgi:hypothetical protein
MQSSRTSSHLTSSSRGNGESQSMRSSRTSSHLRNSSHTQGSSLGERSSSRGNGESQSMRSSRTSSHLLRNSSHSQGSSSGEDGSGGTTGARLVPGRPSVRRAPSVSSISTSDSHNSLGSSLHSSLPPAFQTSARRQRQAPRRRTRCVAGQVLQSLEES